MVLKYPLELANGAPVFVAGVEELAVQMGAVLGTDEGTYYPDLTYGVPSAVFSPTVQLRYVIMSEMATRLPDVKVVGFSTSQKTNEFTYSIVGQRGTQVVKQDHTLLI